MIPLSTKAKQKITDEDINNFKESALEGLPRNKRRSLEREINDMQKALKTMTPTQLKVLNIVTNEKANQKMDRFADVMDKCITAQYVILNPNITLDEIKEYQKQLAKLINEDNNKYCEFMNGGNDFMANEKMKGLEKQVKTRIIQLLEEGKNQKQSLESLVIEFASLSKASLANAFKQTKEEWKKENKDVDRAIEYIFPNEEAATNGEKTECSENKEVQEEFVSDNKQNLDKKESVQDLQNENLDKLKVEKDSTEEKLKMSKLKVKKMVVEGEFGLYEVEGNVITSEKQDLSFCKLEELEEYRLDEVAKIDARVNEFKEVFAMLK
ncbi:hypothetical protein [Clostridium senegalense]|uniref:hypothetical protein n=1 Tax=Clostridium senegalense TaxID=1465809 RepID=UPI0002883AB1|nr:hypothetical protein [Clostridium senegalense]